MKCKSKSKNNLVQSEDLCFEEELDENGICETPITGTPVAEFSFVDNYIPSKEPMLKELELKERESPIPSTNSTNNVSDKFAASTDAWTKDTITYRSEPYGITPPVNGEYFDTRRTFTFRKSTVRKLNELKANHPDINVYLNTIVDNAVCHYYDCISREKVKKT